MVITIISASVQIVGVVILILIERLTLINLALIRGFVEVVIATLRIVFVYKNRKLFERAVTEDIPLVPTEDTVSAN